MKRFVRILLLLACVPPIGVAPVHAQTGSPTAQVKITFVEMSASDVRRLSVPIPPRNRPHDELANLKTAADRRHVPYHVTAGPTLTLTQGQQQNQDVVSVTALQIRPHRADVRVSVVNRPATTRRRAPTRIVAARRIFRSGETRLIAALPAPNGRYRYTFATVTISR